MKEPLPAGGLLLSSLLCAIALLIAIPAAAAPAADAPSKAKPLALAELHRGG
jgi:hypothetical protein